MNDEQRQTYEMVKYFYPNTLVLLRDGSTLVALGEDAEAIGTLAGITHHGRGKKARLEIPLANAYQHIEKVIKAQRQVVVIEPVPSLKGEVLRSMNYPAELAGGVQ